MKKNFDNNIFPFLEWLTQEFGPPAPGSNFLNDEAMQELKNFLPENAFVTITNLRPMPELGQDFKNVVVGISSSLGYDEYDFTLEKSLDIQIPIYRIMVEEYAKTMYTMLHNRVFEKRINNKTSYKKEYLAYNASRNYVRIEETSRIYISDKGGNMLSHINFGMVHETINSPVVMLPQIVHPVNGYFLKEEKQLYLNSVPKILDRIQNEITFNKKPILTPKEFEVARHHFEGRKSPEISELMKISTNGVKQHNKRIVLKIRQLFPPEFNFQNARYVSKFLGDLKFLEFEDHFMY